MTHTAKVLQDGSLEVVTVYTKEDLDRANVEVKAAETLDGIGEAQPQFLGISFKRKTDYCATCSDGSRHTIMAYGDIHAFISALDKCGNGFSMHKGACA